MPFEPVRRHRAEGNLLCLPARAAFHWLNLPTWDDMGNRVVRACFKWAIAAVVGLTARQVSNALRRDAIALPPHPGLLFFYVGTHG
jgi:hypothetical protein